MGLRRMRDANVLVKGSIWVLQRIFLMDEIPSLRAVRLQWERLIGFEILHARWTMLAAFGALVLEIHFVEPVWWRVGYSKLKVAGKFCDIDSHKNGNYLSEDTNEEMEDNEHDGDGPGRPEMEVLRNAIAQSLMNAST